jgi:predicted phosphodiesterase
MIFVGDIHGNFNYIKYLVRSRHLEGETIIQVGDFGIGFNKKHVDLEELQKLNATLRAADCKLYVIRGNHDDPRYFNGVFEFTNLHLVPDYTVINIEGKNVLFVGGATSIDRVYRQEAGYGWWEDEKFVLDTDKLLKMVNIDVVVTHNAPDFCWPLDVNGLVLSFAAEDATLLEDLRNERIDLTRMYDLLAMNNDIHSWYYGHFHNSQLTEYKGTDFRLLGIEESYELR